MAGVASPILKRSRRHGARFLTGLAVGGSTAGLVLALLALLVGQLADHLAPSSVRVGVLITAAVACGLADLSGHTPHVWRQVPQRLVRSLSPGTLGLVWGFDLGLLVTTQKTSSLLWLSIAAIILLNPPLAPIALVAFSLAATAGVVIWSLTPWAMRLEGIRDRTWVRRVRIVTGMTMLSAGLGTLLATVLG